MKRKDLIKLLEKKGWYLKRYGGNHDIYTDGNRVEPIPRHSEINERLAKEIIKKLGL
jgi:predicted RNA binding protein YcfA (HicA-like mRNA interferase family)